MTILQAILTLLIGPLKLFFEVLYSLAYRIIQNPGLAIIALSIAMNILVLPLYRKADQVQAEERDKEAKLQPMIDHIKKTFQGNERFMMLQAYYRESHYNPSFALKGSLSLLLEIPFFIAAYQFLSELQLLHGVSFGPIRDLGAPDALLTLGGLTINLLPILMTTINLISGAIYTKGFPLKSKIQLYGLTVIFLVLLYKSPAGLVFYWTLNNIFSLVKNIFYKMKNPRKALRILASCAGVALIVFAIARSASLTRVRLLFVIALGLVCQLPLIIRQVNQEKQEKEFDAGSKGSFVIGCILLTLVTGVWIPSAVIKASPAEFVDLLHFRSPMWSILHATLIAAGTFLVWFVIFYQLANPKVRRIMGILVWIAGIAGIVNYLAFSTKLGNLSPSLRYDLEPVWSWKEILLNLIVMCAIALLCILVWRKKQVLVRYLTLIACIAIIGLSFMNLSSIKTELATAQKTIKEGGMAMPEITLSREGKNVVVLMLDRFIGSYVPYIMNEKPELEERFDGFTYYPNAISFGGHTKFGFPPILGGYEYTPDKINARDQETLVEKTNEALRVMPVLFYGNGFETTVSDPSLAGYTYPPDLSIYDDYPGINTYISFGKLNVFAESATDQEKDHSVRDRNHFCYSLFRVAPVLFQKFLYNHGMYNSADENAMVMLQEKGVDIQQWNSEKTDSMRVGSEGQQRTGLSIANGMDQSFLDNYHVLKYLDKITSIKESGDTFFLMTNETPHYPLLLEEPSYEPSDHVDNTVYDEQHKDRFQLDDHPIEVTSDVQMTHYHVDMATLMRLGEWFAYLQEEGLWDNTRIILVSDHGFDLGVWPELTLDDGSDVMYFNPLLMVKDFDASGFKTDDHFITNAEVPTMATNELIKDPVNPFSGERFDKEDPERELPKITASHDWGTEDAEEHQFKKAHWYSVHDDLFKRENWSYLGEY